MRKRGNARGAKGPCCTCFFVERKAGADDNAVHQSAGPQTKAEASWRFWGLFVHVCKEETLREAYRLAKKNDGAPGVDGVSFAAIEEGGVDVFIGQIRNDLVSRRYVPMPNRRKEVPKDVARELHLLVRWLRPPARRALLANRGNTQPSRTSATMVTPTRNAAYGKGTPVVPGRRRLVGDRDPGNLAPASLKSEAYSASSTPRRAVSWPSCRKSS